MKFQVTSVCKHGRLGVLTHMKTYCGDIISVDTPICMEFTKTGIAPYMTPDITQMMSNYPQITELSLPNLIESEPAVTSYGLGIDGFIANERRWSICFMKNGADKVHNGFNSAKGIAVWGSSGKHVVNMSRFCEILSAFHPGCFQALCDTDTNQHSSRARVIKSVDRTLDYLEKIIAHETIYESCDTSILGSVVGGYIAEERKRSSELTATQPVQGFVIDGFNLQHGDTELWEFSAIKNLVLSSITPLPLDKIRVMQGMWSPLDVIDGVAIGIDLFDSSYPYFVTERQGALCFCMDISSQIACTSFELDLKDKQYEEDFTPLVLSCSCYSCSHFTRAYIHHLINTAELLAPTLLMIHNVHHYNNFFSVLRECLKSDKIMDLKEALQRQLPSHSKDREDLYKLEKHSDKSCT